jgi:hypothetical protein
MASDAARLQSIADQLASGAHDGVERNAALTAAGEREPPALRRQHRRAGAPRQATRARAPTL